MAKNHVNGNNALSTRDRKRHGLPVYSGNSKANGNLLLQSYLEKVQSQKKKQK